MRSFCLIVSLTLHLALVGALMRHLPGAADDITAMPSVDVTLSEPIPPGPAAPPPPPSGTAARAGGESLPPLALSAPEVKEISPVKREQNEGIWVGKGQLKVGAEERLAMRALGSFDFTLEEYCGYYLIRGTPGRVLSIIDGRRTYGRLLLHDSATGKLRALNQYAKFIFTYTARFDASGPVEGSITFLPSKEKYRTPHVDDRSRVLWIADEPEAMLGDRFDFVEEHIELGGGKTPRAGTLIALRDGGPFPLAVFAGEGRCRDREIYWGFARLMAVRGVAVLVVDPPGCGGDVDEAGPDEPIAAAELVQAWRAAQHSAKVDHGRIGFFGYGAGAEAAAKAAAAVHPAFCVQALDAAVAGSLPPLGRFTPGGASGPPCLFILTGPNETPGAPAVPPASVTVATELVAPGDGRTAGAAGRFLDLVPTYVRLAVPYAAGRGGHRP